MPSPALPHFLCNPPPYPTPPPPSPSSPRRVITAMSKPYVWVHKLVAQDRTGHMDSVRGALYNATFDVIVSADEGGTVCVWSLATGAREGRFNKAHGDAKVWGGREAQLNMAADPG